MSQLVNILEMSPTLLSQQATNEEWKSVEGKDSTERIIFNY